MAEQSIQHDDDIKYDRYGRMQYHPDYHAKHGTPWLNSDQKYLIENYEKDGPESVSFELERTIHTVMAKAYQLRKDGIMPPAKPVGQRISHRRVRSLNSESCND